MGSISKQCFVLLQARLKVVLRFLAFSKKMGVLRITEICKPNVTDVDADSSLIWPDIGKVDPYLGSGSRSSLRQQGLHRQLKQTVLADFAKIMDCENVFISRWCKRRDILREADSVY